MSKTAKDQLIEDMLATWELLGNSEPMSKEKLKSLPIAKLLEEAETLQAAVKLHLSQESVRCIHQAMASVTEKMERIMKQ